MVDITKPAQIETTPFGDAFILDIELPTLSEIIPVRFVHGGWGKIAAAASTQYAIDHFSPYLIINLGTCGGFEGAIERGTVLLVQHTLVYDILEQMDDFDEHIAHYSTFIDLSWLGTFSLPDGYQYGFLVSGDRDLVAEDIPWLKKQFGAYAGDWESGAIAWVAERNSIPVLILRAVSDLVGTTGGEAYGNMALFQANTHVIMAKLVGDLPFWIERAILGLEHKQSDQNSR